MIQVTRAFLPEFDEYTDEIRSLWDTHWLTNMGEKHREFKQRLKDYLDVENLELFVNGHMALEMILQAMDLSGEVITTPFTFASTTHAISRNGLTPVFCDIRRDTYTIDEDKIKAEVSSVLGMPRFCHFMRRRCSIRLREEPSVFGKKNWDASFII